MQPTASCTRAHMIRLSLLSIKFHLITFTNLFNLHSLLCPRVQGADTPVHIFRLKDCIHQLIKNSWFSRAVLFASTQHAMATATRKESYANTSTSAPVHLVVDPPSSDSTSVDPPSPYSSCMESPCMATRLPRIRRAWDPPVTDSSSSARHVRQLTRHIDSACI
jgi:hypothetical protein